MISTSGTTTISTKSYDFWVYCYNTIHFKTEGDPLTSAVLKNIPTIYPHYIIYDNYSHLGCIEIALFFKDVCHYQKGDLVYLSGPIINDGIVTFIEEGEDFFDTFYKVTVEVKMKNR